jgi:LysR family transcriptional regulator, transcriptional activator of nhaA
MRTTFNYKHLYYFWVVAKEGGISRAAERLNMAVQTVSAQVRDLERDLGYALLKPVGRGLVLTEAGQAALRQADQIFQLGERLPQMVRDSVSAPVIRLNTGISDGLPKLVVRKMLQPVLRESELRLQCTEGKFDDLLGDLALHRMDVVLADRPAPPNPSMKLYTHAMGWSPIAWYAHADLHQRAGHDFPAALSQIPILLPTPHSAVRHRIDQWLDQHGIKPRIVGEFEDSALLKTFGASGMGAFPAAEWVHEELTRHYALHKLGACDGIKEFFYAIGTEKKVQHPYVLRILAAGAHTQ